jgi:hypothetical protein
MLEDTCELEDDVANILNQHQFRLSTYFKQHFEFKIKIHIKLKVSFMDPF